MYCRYAIWVPELLSALVLQFQLQRSVASKEGTVRTHDQPNTEEIGGGRICLLCFGF